MSTHNEKRLKLAWSDTIARLAVSDRTHASGDVAVSGQRPHALTIAAACSACSQACTSLHAAGIEHAGHEDVDSA